MQYQGGKSRIAKAIAGKIRELYPTATELLIVHASLVPDSSRGGNIIYTFC